MIYGTYFSDTAYGASSYGTDLVAFGVGSGMLRRDWLAKRSVSARVLIASMAYESNRGIGNAPPRHVVRCTTRFFDVFDSCCVSPGDYSCSRKIAILPNRPSDPRGHRSSFNRSYNANPAMHTINFVSLESESRWGRSCGTICSPGADARRQLPKNVACGSTALPLRLLVYRTVDAWSLPHGRRSFGFSNGVRCLILRMALQAATWAAAAA